jgi:hypothetical protein
MYILMILYALLVHFLHQLLFTGFFFKFAPPLICLKLRHWSELPIHTRETSSCHPVSSIGTVAAHRTRRATYCSEAVPQGGTPTTPELQTRRGPPPSLSSLHPTTRTLPSSAR